MKAAPLNSNLAGKFHRFSHFSVFFSIRAFFTDTGKSQDSRFLLQGFEIGNRWIWTRIDYHPCITPLHYTLALLALLSLHFLIIFIRYGENYLYCSDCVSVKVIIVIMMILLWAFASSYILSHGTPCRI